MTIFKANTFCKSSGIPRFDTWDSQCLFLSSQQVNEVHKLTSVLPFIVTGQDLDYWPPASSETQETFAAQKAICLHSYGDWLFLFFLIFPDYIDSLFMPVHNLQQWTIL